MSYSEDGLVQQPTAACLAELGWETVFAQNESFGDDGLLGRESGREVVLVRHLRRMLAVLNPGLPAAAYDGAVGQLCRVSAAQSLTDANREQYGLIRDGVRVTFRGDDGAEETRLLRVVDFECPDNNHFLCVREFWVRGEVFRRRADVVGFVNGLPLLFVECKGIDRNLRAAFEENYADYKDTVPQLFFHNAVVLFGNATTAKVGSITADWGHFCEWKRLAESEAGRVDMERLLLGVCNRRNFLDIVENFILFDDSVGRVRKILARNHQFLGVNRAVESVRRRRGSGGKLGVFWHTQGAGKSYSMVFFTRKVLRKLGGGYTFLVLTDREDLDAQIYGTFAGCGVVNHDSDPCRAADGAHLRGLLGEQKTHIFSLIQKFHLDVGGGAGDASPGDASPYSVRDDIIIISDEAHRTQYGTLALNMRSALPNAAFIGFTGTPLLKKDEITRQTFGDYVSTYDFQRAVADCATVPLFYELRGDQLGVATDDINERVADALAEFEVDDIDVQQRLERDLKREYHIITAEKRLRQIADDFVGHYSAAWEGGGKAMLVCVDKLTCVRMHGFIGEAWEAKIAELERVAAAGDADAAAETAARIDWMRETRRAVVVSEEQGEVEKFRRWGLDIVPHRALMKRGMDLPESLRGDGRFRHIQRMDLDAAFREPAHPFRVAIVCAMWLTGFDVPCLSALYLDKSLKAHTLMQAIARANRVYEGKNNGLIVDYCGIFKQLQRALTDYIGEPLPGELPPTKPVEDLLAALSAAIAAVRGFLHECGADLDAVIARAGFGRAAAIGVCKNAVNENDETRKRFEIMCRVVFDKFRACINVTGVNEYRAARDAINGVYKSLQQDRETADISAIILTLQKDVVDPAIEPAAAVEEQPLYDISAIDFNKISQRFARRADQKTVVQNLKCAVERRLARLLAQNPLRADFQKHFEAIVAAYNSDKSQAVVQQTFEALCRLVREMDAEEKRAAREGLAEEELAVFDLLKKPALLAKDVARIKKIAVDLLKKLKAGVLLADSWTVKEATCDAVRREIYDFLYDGDTGLPTTQYENADIENYTAEIYRHIFRVYKTLPSSVYDEVA